MVQIFKEKSNIKKCSYHRAVKCPEQGMKVMKRALKGFIE